MAHGAVESHEDMESWSDALQALPRPYSSHRQGSPFKALRNFSYPMPRNFSYPTHVARGSVSTDAITTRQMCVDQRSDQILAETSSGEAASTAESDARSGKHRPSCSQCMCHPQRLRDSLELMTRPESAKAKQRRLGSGAQKSRRADNDASMEKPRPAESDARAEGQDCTTTQASSCSSTSDWKKPHWARKMKKWLLISEPSTGVLRQQTRSSCLHDGAGIKHADAAAKMRLAAGKAAAGVTTSTRGPSPERTLRRRTGHLAASKAWFLRSRGAQALSSGPSLAGHGSQPSGPVAPWR